MANLCEPAQISRIEANRTVKNAIEAGIRNRSARNSISVTDLVNPMQAYHSRLHPEIQIPLERLQFMWTGTGFHRLFGEAVSTEEFLEQFVEKDGVVGKIDIYENTPTEVKTSASLPEDLAAQRPSYVDQLGMYCYMAGEDEGIVVAYRREEYGHEPGLRAFRVRFGDLEAIGVRMRAVRDLFLDAMERRDPTKLARCEWFSRHCDYRAVCPCETAAPWQRIVDPTAVSVMEDADLAETLREAATRGRVRPKGHGISLNDLVFPRRGVLMRTVGREDDDEDNLADMQRSGFYGTLVEAIRHAEPGAYRGAAVTLEALKAVVHTHHGIPVVIRTTNTLDMIERDRLPSERPYWLDRLALETALVGQAQGRLVVYYPRVGIGDRFMVYDIGFRRVELTIEEARRRLALFETQAGTDAFPSCGPEWMSRYCPFKNYCACS